MARQDFYISQFAPRFPNLYNPSAVFLRAVVAQLVEQLIRNQ